MKNITFRQDNMRRSLQKKTAAICQTAMHNTAVIPTIVATLRITTRFPPPLRAVLCTAYRKSVISGVCIGLRWAAATPSVAAITGQCCLYYVVADSGFEFYRPSAPSRCSR